MSTFTESLVTIRLVKYELFVKPIKMHTDGKINFVQTNEYPFQV